MARRLSQPSSPSPVTITVSPTSKDGSGGGAGNAARRKSIGLTSPVPRHFTASPRNSTRRDRYLSASETDTSSDFVHYTVQIPPTPDHPMGNAAQGVSTDSMPGSDRSFISGTIFTGGLNCVTRARHVLDCSSDTAKSKGLNCKMRGCDGTPFRIDNRSNPPCECGFVICKDCYLECVTTSGTCPGCKEPYQVNLTDESDIEEEEEEGEEGEEGRDRVLPLTSMVRSVKVPNGKPAHEFDHTRWLFETKGTYGYGNALWPKDGGRNGNNNAGINCGFEGFEEPPNFGAKCRRPLTRKIGAFDCYKASSTRVFSGMEDSAPEPGSSLAVGHVGYMRNLLPKLCPVNRATDLTVLKERFESPSVRNPKGRSDLPGIDVFVSTADPEKEPPLVTANTILSILAADYPVEKLSCYLSDDGGALLSFEALAETASFARTWVPFCRKHDIEPRNPEAYFGVKRDFLKNKVRLDFVRERRKVKREYDEFKVRINSLPESIRRRSDAYNAHDELVARKKMEETGGNLGDVKFVRATWMSDGSHWPGTWLSAEPDHSRGDHAGIIQVMLAPPPSEPVMGGDSSPETTTCSIDTRGVDTRLPMLVYVSREKQPGYDHNKKAGAMNALVRTSAVMSNGPFILNLDCDHYVANSLFLREGMCFMLDRGGDRICYVQFLQRFEGINPSDRYANHNLVFFDVTMRAMDGLQGPVYVGTGCIFRGTALYGFNPPRATEHSGWFGRRKIKLFFKRQQNMGKKHDRKREDEVMIQNGSGAGGNGEADDDIESASLLPKQFGSSAALVASIPVAEFQGLLLQDLLGTYQGRPSGALAVPREPLDAATVAEAISVISCFYEDRTEWGRRVGWIYGSVTEDVVTGYRMHNRGWRSVYCVTAGRDAFRGTAPINLTDRLHQVLRWATGSVEIFFSQNNALFASPRMKFLQRVSYFNGAMYPFTSVFLLLYCILPAVSMFSGKFVVQSLNVTFLVFLLIITTTMCLLALLEIKWSGITLHEWWRNEQFWLIGGTSAHPAAVLQGLLKVIAGVDISFTLTSKSAGDDTDDLYADLYIVKWSFLMVPPVTIMMVNAIAIAVAVMRTVYSMFPRWSELLGGVFFSFWVLCHLYPFAKGLMGRRGKVPTIVFVWSGLLSIVISLLWVYISPPAGAKRDYMEFHFP
ncbi:cellulose synthase-like protein D5 [Carex littledalei]|uniref:Cellulose synthase-like protein D5 n=1 Tax=Carex littledalei TaxID=544730 RepID=A0A833RKV3_9POAL|nr:cellulose synthase-like protein D5 [Carex littledalei]